MPSRSSKVGRLRNLTAILLAGVALGATALAAENEAPTNPWRLLIEPKFMRPEISSEVANSQRTLIVPAREVNGFPEYLAADTLESAGLTRAQFTEQALENATATLDSLKPEYIRDSDQVIQFGVLEADSPYVASTVLSPEFGKRFEAVFGPEFLVAIPHRGKVYLFPKLATRFPRYAEMVIVDYLGATYPVSRELFEWKEGKLRAVGYFP